VFATRWQEWFCNAEYFDELVLWMDCCMVFDLTVVPEAAGYRIVQGTSVKKMFSAYAAQFPQQAVERQMPDDNLFHGVFTYALLRGLRGEAAHAVTRQVTSGTLKNYLFSNMNRFMTADQRSDPTVSQEPDFGFDDPMVFCTVKAAAEATVTLSFPPAAEGRTFRIVTGAPPQEIKTGAVKQGAAAVNLAAGLYFVKVDGLAIAKGFEIAGAEAADIAVA
jgi:hypothetical protein